MADLARDSVLALRALANSPSLVLIVILSVGLGVGANAMVSTWLDQLVLDPFPAVPDAGKLVVLSPLGPDQEVRGMPPLATGLITLVALTACLAPALRAVRLSPLTLLK